QQRGQPHGREPRPLEGGLCGYSFGPTGEERAEGGEREEQDRGPPKEPLDRPERGVREQALPHVHVKQCPQTDDDENASCHAHAGERAVPLAKFLTAPHPPGARTWLARPRTAARSEERRVGDGRRPRVV